MKTLIIKNCLIVILTAAFFLASSNAYGQQNSTIPKVKTVIVYEEKFDKLISKKVKESETTYDIIGNILEDIQYKEGKVDKHFRYQYDENNNKIRETEFDPNGNIIEYSVYRYERNLRIEKKVFDPRGKLMLQKEYVYTTF